MGILSLRPYTEIKDKSYQKDIRIVIKASDFSTAQFQDNDFTFSFIRCKFKKIELENVEKILHFTEIHILFIDCFIEDIKVDNFIATDFSLYIRSSILKGIIKSKKLTNINIGNCLLIGPLFFLDLKSIRISYTEENIFPIRWRKLLSSAALKFRSMLAQTHSFEIHNCNKVVFTFNKNNTNRRGYYRCPSSFDDLEKIQYYLSEEEKRKFKVSLNIKYSADNKHELTQIINANLLNLSILGYSTGELLIENCNIDNWYIRNFSTQLGAHFYNIQPYRKNSKERKLEIHKSNLDKIWFDNVAFNDYSTISLYRNKFGQTTRFTSCDFPKNYEDFDKIQTVANIHYPEEKDNNYFKIRYETFLQIKKVLEVSGNFYEAQKFQAISYEALKNIEDPPYSDKLILKINSFSNSHGLSIKKPFIYTIFTSIFLYILYLWALGRMFNHNEIDWNLIGYYFSFLDITHRIDFLANKTELNGFCLTIDYFNKIVVGFLIYQFISAFRKYEKNK